MTMPSWDLVLKINCLLVVASLTGHEHPLGHDILGAESKTEAEQAKVGSQLDKIVPGQGVQVTQQQLFPI